MTAATETSGIADTPPDAIQCRICGNATVDIGCLRGRFHPTMFCLRHCPACRYSFVANPWTDYDKIYGSDYYTGKGADPKVDYVFELEHPLSTIRQYEWRGLLKFVRRLTKVDAMTRWLDFGCGNGGLVRHVRQKTSCQIFGFEEGWICAKASGLGIPIHTAADLLKQEGTFRVVTAIEVLEHVPDPLSCLRRIRQLLEPGGILVVTTGNARPYRRHLARWGYVVPEIHVSFFEPQTLDMAMRLSGLEPEQHGYAPGFTDIIRFKVLKNIGFRKVSLIEKAVPWGVVSRVADMRYGISAHPIGRRVK